MAELGIAAALVVAIATPHAVPLKRVAPLLAAAVWVNALLLRTVVAVGGAVFVFVTLPQSELFEAGTPLPTRLTSSRPLRLRPR
jgi:hypothetical protein